MVALFEKELKKGTGIPLLLLLENVITPDDQITQIIIDCILETNYFDAQVEGTRGCYLYEIVSNYHQNEKIYLEIIKVFEKMTEHGFPEFQIANFVSNMVKNNLYLMEKYYEKVNWYVINFSDEYSVPGIREIIDIDGIEAIKHFSRLMGKIVHDGNEHFLFNQFLQGCTEYSIEEIKTFLKNENDTDINYFLNYIDKKQNNTLYDRKRLSFEEIKQKYEKGEVFRPLHIWLKKATNDEIKKLSHLYLEMNNIKLKSSILRGFSNTKIEIDEKYLWKELKLTRNLDYKDAIIDALKNFDNVSVKNLVKQYWNEEKTRMSSLRAFIHYTDEEDEYMLDYYLDGLNIWEIHDIITDIIECNNIRKLSFYPNILRKLYEKNNCGYCREKIILEMQKMKCLDKNTLNEIQYDSNNDIRKIANEHKSKIYCA